MKKYLPLMTLCDIVAKKTRAQDKPLFLAPVISHQGEFGQHTFQLIELLAANVKQHKRKNPTADGISPQRAAADFREFARNTLTIAAATGWANMLLEGGIPLRKSGG